MKPSDQKENIFARAIVILILVVIFFLLAGAGRIVLTRSGMQKEQGPAPASPSFSPQSGFRGPTGPPNMQEPPGPPPNY